MVTINWLGTADAVAQVTETQITANDAATTYKVTIGGQVESVTGAASASLTADALRDKLNASTKPYFAAITWTSSVDKVIGKALTPGVPFVFTTSVTGGAGTISAASTTTASAGPNDWSTAANHSGGAVPVNSDDVIIADNAIDIAWGLDQNAVTLTSLTVRQSYTGRIGLDYRAFATSVDARTVDLTEVEYRDKYLKIGSTDVALGQNTSSITPTGSDRIMLDLHTVESTCVVHNTSVSSAETDRPAVRLLANKNTTDVFVRLAPGGIGIAFGEPGETSTIRKLSVSDQGASSRIFVSDGVTLTNYDQSGGVGLLMAAATIATVTVDGGTLTTEGDFTITTLENAGGTILVNHIKTGGDAITSADLFGGLLDGDGSTQSRTWDAVTLRDGASMNADGATITITTLSGNLSFSGR